MNIRPREKKFFDCLIQLCDEVYLTKIDHSLVLKGNETDLEIKSIITARLALLGCEFFGNGLSTHRRKVVVEAYGLDNDVLLRNEKLAELNMSDGGKNLFMRRLRGIIKKLNIKFPNRLNKDYLRLLGLQIHPVLEDGKISKYERNPMRKALDRVYVYALVEATRSNMQTVANYLGMSEPRIRSMYVAGRGFLRKDEKLKNKIERILNEY